MDFDPLEIRVLAELRDSLPAIREWPPENPLSFILMLAPRTKGKLGEMLLNQIAVDAGCTTARATSVDYDVGIGGERYEVKLSTEDPPRYQQVRDPRLPDGSMKYDVLVGISARPEGLRYWMIPAADVADLMDQGHIIVQHAMSDTKWFLPSRTSDDVFSGWRVSYRELSAMLCDRIT